MDILDQLFKYDDLEDACADTIHVTGVTLVVPIGKFPEGSEFNYAVLDWTKSRLILGLTSGAEDESDTIEYTYNLKLTATDAPLT